MIIMLPEFGHFSLIIALCLASIQAIFPALGVWRRNPAWMALGKPMAIGQFVFIAFSFSCLLCAFISNDFSVAYVAQNSNAHLPLLYRIAALWGAHEGSVLLWVMILSAWTIAVALLSQALSKEMLALVLAVLGFLSAGFLLFLLTTSNPFLRLLPNVPLEGVDLNPLLQDPGLAFHPPGLYMGYVGFAVAFAFAIAALINGRLDATWARCLRPWVIASWCFLTMGITLGSWWAYRELGWGGWWFWDPVENASLLPWLTGTALLHSLIVTEKRDAFKSWTVLLAIFAFSLSLLGTFLVRSGILVSVHAFATDPARGAFLLKFLTCVIGGALLLYAVRAPTVRSGGYFAVLSRETFLLVNNVLLMVIMATILLGTLYPLVLDALSLAKISVGPPYFNAVFVPLMIPVLFFMGIAPLCYWREMRGLVLIKKLIYPFTLGLILSITLLFFFAQKISLSVAIGLFFAFWVIVATIQSVIIRIYKKKLTRRVFAMMFAHLGIAVCVIGVTLTTAYQTARDVRMQPGDSVELSGYQFKFLGLQAIHGANYTGAAGVFEVMRNNQFVDMLRAEKRIYTTQQTVMTKAAIDVNLWCDLYIALGDPLENNAWGVRIYYKPFVRWIWFGGFLIILGGVLTFGRKKEEQSDNKMKKLKVLNHQRSFRAS